VTTTASHQTAELDKLEALAKAAANDQQSSTDYTLAGLEFEQAVRRVKPSLFLALIAQARATGTQGASIDTPEFQKLLAEHIDWQSEGTRRSLVAHINAHVRAQLALQRKGEPAGKHPLSDETGAWGLFAESVLERAAPQASREVPEVGITEDEILSTIFMFRRAGEGTPFGAETAQRCARVIFGKIRRCAAPSPASAEDGEKRELPQGWQWVAVNAEFDSLMYWMDRAHGNQNLPSDVSESWDKFEYRDAAKLDGSQKAGGAA
jgi:hypothetical protein